METALAISILVNLIFGVVIWLLIESNQRLGRENRDKDESRGRIIDESNGKLKHQKEKSEQELSNLAERIEEREKTIREKDKKISRLLRGIYSRGISSFYR